MLSNQGTAEAQLFELGHLGVIMHVMHSMPVLVVGLDGVQHWLCRWDELCIALKQRKSHNLKEAHLH